jgi:hypothetical protein
MLAQKSSPLNTSTVNLVEETESIRFYQDDHWDAYTQAARSSPDWRSQNKILVKHLLSHRNRLRPYPWSPRDSWLVGWALWRMQPPIRELLVWSLKEDVEREEDVTIEIFYDHLEVWADLFRSPRTKHLALCNLAQHTRFILDQREVGASWIALYLATDPLHREWLCKTWTTYWRRNVVREQQQQTDCEMTEAVQQAHEEIQRMREPKKKTKNKDKAVDEAQKAHAQLQKKTKPKEKTKTKNKTR